MLIEIVSRFIEVCGNMGADFVDDVGAVVVDSFVELSCCASNVLFVTFGAGDEVYYVGSSTG